MKIYRQQNYRHIFKVVAIDDTATFYLSSLYLNPHSSHRYPLIIIYLRRQLIRRLGDSQAPKVSYLRAPRHGDVDNIAVILIAILLTQLHV